MWNMARVTAVPVSFVVPTASHCFLSLRIHGSMRAAGVGLFDFGSFATCSFTEFVPEFDISVAPLI